MDSFAVDLHSVASLELAASYTCCRYLVGSKVKSYTLYVLGPVLMHIMPANIINVPSMLAQLYKSLPLSLYVFQPYALIYN